MCQDCKNNHTTNNNFSSGMMFGIMLGAAATLFLTTDRGKDLLDDLKDRADEAVENLSENDEIKQKIADAQQAVNHARASIESTRSQFNTRPSTRSTQEPKKVKVKVIKPKLFSRSGSPLK